jgi:hypothetical protein
MFLVKPFGPSLKTASKKEVEGSKFVWPQNQDVRMNMGYHRQVWYNFRQENLTFVKFGYGYNNRVMQRNILQNKHNLSTPKGQNCSIRVS